MPEEAVFKGLDQGGHGVGQCDPLVVGRYFAQRINHGGGIHGQLYPKLHQKNQIAVFGGQGGDDEAEAQSQPRQQQDQYWKQESSGIGRNGCTTYPKIKVEGNEEQHLDAIAHQVGGHNAQGHHQAREIDLAKQVLVVAKGGTGFVEAFGKVVPIGYSGQVKQHGWDAIGR